jgi:hypothetical protein
LQPRTVVGYRLLLDTGENLLAALGQLVEVIHEIDQEEFRAEGARERRLDAKVELAAAQRELAVSFVIIDNGLVIELGRADTERVVGVGRGQEKSVVAQERLNELLVLGRGFPEVGVLREQIEPAP